MPLIPLFLPTPEEPLPVPVPWPHGDHYDIVVETPAGVRLAPLPSAVLDTLEDPLNAFSTATVKVSCWDPNIGALLNEAGEVALLAVYVCVVMNGVPIHRGPVLTAEIDVDGLMTLTVPDPSWWLTRRVIGRAQRDNMLGTGLFTIDDWNEANCDPDYITTDVTIPGSYSAKLPAPVDYGPGSYIERIVNYTPTDFSKGLTYIAVGHLKVPAAVQWQGRVMEVLRYKSEADRLADKPADRQTIAPDNLPDPDADGWIPLPLPFFVPPGVGGQNVVRFMAPKTGYVLWGSGYEQVRDDTFASGEHGEDLATLAKWAVQWAQDPDKGNTDLNITTNCPVGVATIDTLSVPEHLFRTIADVLDTDLVNRAGGVDWRIQYGRRATVFATGYPRFNFHRTDLPLRVGRYWRSLPWNVDASDLDTDEIVTGDNDGFWAQSGSYVDRSATGGVNLVGVYAAPSGTPYGRLNKVAQRRGEVRTDVKREPTGTLPAYLWPWTTVGEVYSSQHSMGKVQLAGDHRSQTRTLKPSDGVIEVHLEPVYTGKDLADDLLALEQRVTQLQQRPSPTLRAVPRVTQSFSQSGPVDLLTSPTYQHPNSAALVEAHVALTSPASDDLVLHFTADGVAGPSFTVPAGETRHREYLEPVQLGNPGALSVTSESGGTDGTDLTVVAVLREQSR